MEGGLISGLSIGVAAIALALLMLLKPFIRNLYQAVLVTILTEAERTEQGEGLGKCPPGGAGLRNLRAPALRD